MVRAERSSTSTKGGVTNLNRYHQAERRLWDKLDITPVDRRVTLRSGGEVRVQEVGDGAPMVFIHGGAIAGSSWCQLVAGLEGVRCILVDRPGCGLSDPIVGGPLRDLTDVEAYADQLLPDLLDALDLERAMVGATSYGGLFAFRGAAAAPERVEKLIEYSWLIGGTERVSPILGSDRRPPRDAGADDSHADDPTDGQSCASSSRARPGDRRWCFR